MTERFLSQRTADMVVLLCNDGVDREELKALVSSAFEDGIDCTLKQMDGSDDREDF